MRIKVINDGEQVFEGAAQEFLEINEGDECIEDMVMEARECGYSTAVFFSGKWEIFRAGGV